MHVNNDYSAIPLAYSRECKETYVVIKTILELINYKKFQWSVGDDLKMVGLLTGLQNGYIKHGRNDHYIKKSWPLRNKTVIGKENMKNEPLIKKTKVLLPPLHILQCWESLN